MSRLQKKCFLGAASMHVLLFVVLIVGPGFFSKDTMEESDVLTFIPLMATDEDKKGGGTPQPQVPTPQNTQPPTPTPPPPQPPVAEPVREPEPPQVRQPVKEVEQEKEKPTRDNHDSLDPQPDKSKKHEVKVNTNVVKIRKPNTNSSNTDTTAQERKDTERAAANAKLFANAGKSISKGLAPSTKIEMSDGPGGGGVSYAPYGQIVRKIYTDGWTVPDDMTDDEATIKVSVTIARDGTVLSSRIVQPSGSAAANRSIQNTLDRITTIGIPFPAGAKESQRTFIMTFNLKAKKALG